MIVRGRDIHSMAGRRPAVSQTIQRRHQAWQLQGHRLAKVQLVRHIVQYTEGHGIFIQRQVRQLDTHTTCTMSLQVLVIVKVTAQRGVDIHSSVGRLAVLRPVHLAVAFH